MAALIRHGARGMGGSLQIRRTQAAVAEERRRLLPRRMYSTDKGAGKDDDLSKFYEKWEAFRRFDYALTEVLKGVAGIYCFYGILSVTENPPWPIRKYIPPELKDIEEEAQTDKKKRQE